MPNENFGDRWLFVPYSRKDFAEYAEPFVAVLKVMLAGRPELGFHEDRVFFDTAEIHGGDDWKAKIVEVMPKTGALVMLLSPESLTSSVCLEEVRLALGAGARLVPVLVRQCGYKDKAVPGDGEGRKFGALQVLPRHEDGRLVAVKNWEDHDGAWQAVVEQVAEAIGPRAGGDGSGPRVGKIRCWPRRGRWRTRSIP